MNQKKNYDRNGNITYVNDFYNEANFVNWVKAGKDKYFWRHDEYYNEEWKKGKLKMIRCLKL